MLLFGVSWVSTANPFYLVALSSSVMEEGERILPIHFLYNYIIIIIISCIILYILNIIIFSPNKLKLWNSLRHRHLLLKIFLFFSFCQVKIRRYYLPAKWVHFKHLYWFQGTNAAHTKAIQWCWSFALLQSSGSGFVTLVPHSTLMWLSLPPAINHVCPYGEGTNYGPWLYQPIANNNPKQQSLPISCFIFSGSFVNTYAQFN